MKIIKSVTVILLGFLVSSHQLLSNDREIIANYTTKKPKIDGKLNDDVWQSGVWFTDFTLTTDSKKLAQLQTEFQVAYDDENFYLAARMFESEPGHLKLGEFRRDGGIFQDDHLELMLDPFGDRHEYFHFGVNPVGIQYDAKQRFGGEFYDIEWNADWQAATKIGSRCWTVEIAIPFAELSLNKESKDKWSFNIARQRYAGKHRELSSFSPMEGSFSCISKFSKLYFPVEKFDKFFWHIKGPTEYHIEADKGDWILTGKVEIRNDTNQNEQFKLLFKQINQKGAMEAQVITDVLAKDEKKVYDFKLPVERQDPLELQMEIVNAANLKEVFKSRRAILNVNYNLIDFEILNPWYRNNIYFTESVPELRLLVNLSLAQKVLKESKLHLKLITEKTKNVVSDLEIENLARVQEIKFPLGDIIPGNYILEGKIIDNQGIIVAQSSEHLRKLRHEDNEWRLSDTDALIHNGNEFLPQGLIRILPDEEQLIHASIYNTVFMPIDLIQDEEKIKKFLDNLHKSNAYAVIYPYVTMEMVNTNKHLARVLIGTEIQAIQQRIKNLKKHPAVMGWLIADQPENDSVLPERLKRLYSIIKEEDPFHPVVIINSSLKGIAKYAGMSDITVASTKIPFMKDDGIGRPINWMSYYLDVAKKEAGKKVSFWVGLQMYDCTQEAKTILSFTELRNMFYQAVIGGGKGFFWYDYQHFYNFPEIKLGADYLAQEIYLLKDAILAPKSEDKIHIECDDKNAILLSQKIDGKDHTLFVVNTSSSPQKVNLESTFFKNLSQFYVLSENRIVKIKENVLIDEFEPYATHIYSTREYGRDFNSLNSVEQRIEEANKARKKEGNLAFIDSGIKITASSSKELCSIHYINDGINDGLSWESDENELPQWVELHWPKPIRIEKILLFSDTIEHAKVQEFYNNAWIDLGEFVRRSGAHLRAIFPETELTRIRILITEKKPGTSNVSLSEIEVYNRLTKVANY